MSREETTCLETAAYLADLTLEQWTDAYLADPVEDVELADYLSGLDSDLRAALETAPC